MIIGIGTDLVEIRRIKDLLSRQRSLEKIFTTKELVFANDNAATLAGNFAVKEAVSKVFGTGFFGVEPYEIEVMRDERGAPFINLSGQAEILALKLGIDQIHVSITNTAEYAQAFAIGERR